MPELVALGLRRGHNRLRREPLDRRSRERILGAQAGREPANDNGGKRCPSNLWTWERPTTTVRRPDVPLLDSPETLSCRKPLRAPAALVASVIETLSE